MRADGIPSALLVKRRGYRSFFSFWMFALAVLILLTTGCQRRKEPIRIGFVGGLTGRVAALGTAGRDGARLAVEEANAAGGIQGRPVELLVRDDEQNAGTAQKAVTELVDAGVVALVGHMTSSMSEATLPIANERRVLMISPTSSTNSLTGIDDYFFRIYPASRQVSALLSRRALQARGIRRMSIVYDLGNRSYTESMYDAFKEAYTDLGGRIVSVHPFTSGPGYPFSELTRDLLAQEPQGLLILANAMDTALICQKLARSDHRLPVFTGEWSIAGELLQFGGRTIEGLEFYHTFNPAHKGPAFTRFREGFLERFGYEAGFASTHAYDSTRVLLQSLKKDPDPTRLKDTVRNIGSFEGLQGKIQIDRFGDVTRNHFLMTVRDGRFVAQSETRP